MRRPVCQIEIRAYEHRTDSGGGGAVPIIERLSRRSTPRGPVAAQRPGSNRGRDSGANWLAGRAKAGGRHNLDYSPTDRECDFRRDSRRSATAALRSDKPIRHRPPTRCAPEGALNTMARWTRPCGLGSQRTGNLNTNDFTVTPSRAPSLARAITASRRSDDPREVERHLDL